MFILSLCYDGGKPSTSLGSVLVAPFVHFFFFFYASLRKPTSMDHYGRGYPCIVDSGGIRIVRSVSTRAAGGRGHVTCIVPFPALPLVPSQCEYLFSASFTTPPS